MQQSIDEIRAILNESCEHELSLFVKLRHQQGEILTIARQMAGDVVFVEPVSLQSLELPRTCFYIQEIESVSIAKIFHNASLYAKIRDLKGNLRQLQHRLLSKGRVEIPVTQG